MTDHWLMLHFPGRTLEELDGVDMGRLGRALEAQRVVRLEAKRDGFIAGKIEQKSMAPDEWAAIQTHEALMAEY